MNGSDSRDGHDADAHADVFIPWKTSMAITPMMMS